MPFLVSVQQIISPVTIFSQAQILPNSAVITPSYSNLFFLFSGFALDANEEMHSFINKCRIFRQFFKRQTHNQKQMIDDCLDSLKYQIENHQGIIQIKGRLLIDKQTIVGINTLNHYVVQIFNDAPNSVDGHDIIFLK